MAGPSKMQQQAQTLNAGIQAFQRGDYAATLSLLSRMRHPTAMNLAAVSAQRLGDDEQAERIFKQASRRFPRDAQIANNRGHFERARRQFDTAEQCFRTALTVDPTMTQARLGLAGVMSDQERWQEAERAWADVLDAAPTSRTAQYGRAKALLNCGKADEAQSLFRKLHSEQPQAEIAFMLGRAAMELNDVDEAFKAFGESVERNPTGYAFQALAELAWMNGDRETFHTLIDQAPRGVVATAANLVRQTGDLEKAEAIWRTLAAGSANAEAWSVGALIARDRGETDALIHRAGRALALSAGSDAAIDTLIVGNLMRGDVSEALRHIAERRTAEPLKQHWIAHESIALRLADDPGVDHLIRPDDHIRTFRLSPPDGFADMDTFNAALTDAMDQLQTLSARPLGQSLRGAATQTIQNLSEINEPTLKAYLSALDRPIRSYLEAIGDAPDHPLTARNTGIYDICAMWSVRLSGGGWHESHVHPEGWISAVYYAKVPDGTAASPDKAGWIGFGAPSYPTVPPCDALRWIAPEAGMLVLFPSFMWHGVNPVNDGAERVTIPFDLIPG
ncbi:MAG: putative 2OG-Fe(II) oxygenase [Pseudomonadota bacterium]